MGEQKPASGSHPPRRCGRIAAFLCPVKAVEVRTERKRERKGEQARRAAQVSHWNAGGHSVMHCGASSQGSYENKFMLHLRHCGGGGLPEDRNG